MSSYWLIFPYLLALVTGLALGSFANVLIYRVPRGLSLTSPPSSCPGCGHRIRPLENIPLLSWLLLKARCSACDTRIPFRYPLVELITGLLAISLAWKLPLDWGWIPWLLAACLLVALSLIDLDCMRLPNPLVLSLAIVGLLAQLPGLAGFPLAGLPTLSGALQGAVVGAGTLGAFALLGKLWLKRDAMGMGDIKLMGALGLMLGWELILLDIVMAAVLATLYMALAGQKRGVEFPFGPWLAISGWLCFLFGWKLIDWYLALIMI